MTLSIVLIINAIFAGLGGLGLVLMPDQLINPYGATLNDGGRFMSQLLGVILLGLAAISWNFRNIKTKEDRKMLLPGFIIAHAGAAAFGFAAYNNGLFNSMIWVDVIMHAALGVAFAYYLFIKK